VLLLVAGVFGCRERATVKVDVGDAGADAGFDDIAPTDAAVDAAPADAAVADATPADAAVVDVVETDGQPLGLVAVISNLIPRSVYLQTLAASGTLTTRAVLPVPEAAQAFTSSADGRFLFVLGRRVASFAVDRATAGLTAINESVTGLSNWAGLAVHPGRRWLILSDNTSGIAVFGLQPDSAIVQPPGALVTTQVASDLTWDPTGKYLFALSCYTDVIARYVFDADTGALVVQAPALPAPDLGPGRLVFHPSGKTAYMLNIRGQSVTSFAYDAETGALAQPETASLLASASPDLTAFCYPGHLVVHPSGRFAYATTDQSAGQVAIMSIAASGRLTVVDHEDYFLFRGADALAIDPTGTFLLVGNTAGGLQVFRIDQTDGRLTYVTFGLQGVVALAFLPGQ
jgi:6-phosphogluconolactonase